MERGPYVLRSMTPYFSKHAPIARLSPHLIRIIEVLFTNERGAVTQHVGK